MVLTQAQRHGGEGCAVGGAYRGDDRRCRPSGNVRQPARRVHHHGGGVDGWRREVVPRVRCRAVRSVEHARLTRSAAPAVETAADARSEANAALAARLRADGNVAFGAAPARKAVTRRGSVDECRAALGVVTACADARAVHTPARARTLRAVAASPPGGAVASAHRRALAVAAAAVWAERLIARFASPPRVAAAHGDPSAR